jgi:polar amino acid transport system substrate-binding protein
MELPVNRTHRSRGVKIAAAVFALGLIASACGSDDDGGTADAATNTVAGTAAAASDDSTAPAATITENSAAPVAVATEAFDTTVEQDSRIRVDKVDSIADTLPDAWKESGKLKVGVGAFDAPPLILYADDETTVIGNEIDIAYLVADILGLEIEIEPTSWENLFLSVDSGQYDAAFSNITVTEERKAKYDFASYRVDSLAFEAKDGSTLVVNGPADVAGLKVAVGSGTNQEQILLAWDAENQAAGLEPAEISYYQNEADFLLALDSGRIDLYFGPSPSASYRHETTGKTQIVGVVPGGGDIPAQIAAMTLKDSGLAAPIAAALNSAIESGAYGEVLAKWGLEVEAIETSEVNPPGLPAT